MINWDSFGDDEPFAADANVEQTFAPDGTHTCKIVWVGIQQKPWAKSERNSDGSVLTVKLEVAPKYKPVWESIPCQYRGKVEQLCRAASIDPPSGEWDEQVLKGRMVTVETVLTVSKAGNEFVKVCEWKPGPEQLPAAVRATPARTPAARVRAASPAIGSDDIPF